MGDSVFVGDVPRVRLDGGTRHFRRRWGYDAAATAGSGSGIGAATSLLEDIDEDADDYYSDTYSLRSELCAPAPAADPQQPSPPMATAQGTPPLR